MTNPLIAAFERAEAEFARLKNIEYHAQMLIDDVERRHPGEPLRSPYLIALKANLRSKP